MKEYRVTVETAITVVAENIDFAKKHAEYIIRKAVEEAKEEMAMDVIETFNAVVSDYDYVEVKNCVMME